MTENEIDKMQTKLLLALKEISLNGLCSFQLDHLLFNSTRNCFVLSKKRKILELIKKIMTDTYKLNYKDQQSSLLMITYVYKRQDHKESWKQFIDLFNKYDEITIETMNFSLENLKDPISIIRSIICWIKYTITLCRKINIEDSFLLSAYLVELKGLNQKLNKISKNWNVSVVYFDGGYYENVIVQNLMDRKVRTITLQHGQPVFHGKDKDRINQTMILNFTSDYIITTGAYSKKQFIAGGVNEQQIMPFGSFRICQGYKINNGNHFVVMLDGPTIEKASSSNIEMIKLAEKLADVLNMPYLIKLHPNDIISKYNTVKIKKGEIVQINMPIKEIMRNVKFVLLHASGVYIDILALGIKAYCYQNNVKFPLVDKPLELFHELNELLNNIYSWDSMTFEEQKSYFCDLVNYYLNPNGSTERYKKFISSFL